MCADGGTKRSRGPFLKAGAAPARRDTILLGDLVMQNSSLAFERLVAVLEGPWRPTRRARSRAAASCRA